LSNLILVIWLVSSVASLVFLHSGIREYKQLTILPVLFFFLLFYISIYPFLQNSSQRIKWVKANTDVIGFLCILYLVIIIIPGIEIVIQAIPKLSSSTNLAESMADIHDDRQAGDVVTVINFSVVGSICWRVIGFSTILPVFLTFYLLANWRTVFKKHIYKVLSLSGLIVVFVVQSLFYFVNSQRSMIARLVIIALGCYVLFYNLYGKKQKKEVLKWGAILGGVVISALIFITIARFNVANDRAKSIHDQTVYGWTSLYLGEGFLNYNEYVWNMRVPTEGDVCFLYYKKLLGYDRIVDDYHRRTYWMPKAGIPQHIFYTYIGAFVEDLTPLGAFLLFSIITLVINSIIKIGKNGTITIQEAYFMIIIFYVIANGWSYYAFGGLNKGARLWHELLIYAIFSLSMNKSKLPKIMRR
jgi:oligosaccharide repeat unit polymerase